MAFALFWFIIRADINRVGNLVASVNSLTLVLALLFDVLNIIFYGTAWYFLVHTLHKVRLAKCVQGVMISIFGDILVPTASVTGEARSEERRVGKECGWGGARGSCRKK